jgi:hypothetical protein
MTVIPDSIPMTDPYADDPAFTLHVGGKLAMGQRVSISFAVPTVDTPIEVTATVRWSDAKSTGLQFDGLRARDVWALNKFFQQLSSSP